MDSDLFNDDGHIQTWVYFPPAWNGNDVWTTGFTEEQKNKIFDHMKNCLECRRAEIEATLQWAALRPRASKLELIPVKIADTRGASIVADFDSILPLVEHIEMLVKEIKKILKSGIIGKD
jgi:hypothetical protein